MKYFVMGLLISMGWCFGRFMINSVINILLSLCARYTTYGIVFVVGDIIPLHIEKCNYRNVTVGLQK